MKSPSKVYITDQKKCDLEITSTPPSIRNGIPEFISLPSCESPLSELSLSPISTNKDTYILSYEKGSSNKLLNFHHVKASLDSLLANNKPRLEGLILDETLNTNDEETLQKSVEYIIKVPSIIYLSISSNAPNSTEEIQNILNLVASSHLHYFYWKKAQSPDKPIINWDNINFSQFIKNKDLVIMDIGENNLNLWSIHSLSMALIKNSKIISIGDTSLQHPILKEVMENRLISYHKAIYKINHSLSLTSRDVVNLENMSSAMSSLQSFMPESSSKDSTASKLIFGDFSGINSLLRDEFTTTISSTQEQHLAESCCTIS